MGKEVCAVGVISFNTVSKICKLLYTLKLIVMRYAALPGMLILFVGSAANAQLSIQPQIGLEQSKTSFSFNNSTYSSLPTQLEPKGAVRLDYKFKKGHGPFMSVGSSPGVSSVHFSGFGNMRNQFATTVGPMQWRLEGGYQYSSKPINFKKGNKQKPATPVTNKTVEKRCGSYNYRVTTENSSKANPAKNASWNMRLQPSAGAAYVPNAKENVTVDETITQTTYQYKAGNYTTAFVTGLGLLFGKGTRDMFSLNVYYLKGLTNLNNQTLTKITEGKTTTAQLRSATSSWSLSFGLPLLLQKQKQVKTVAAPPPSPKPVEKKESYKSHCGQYSRCTRGYN